MGIRAEETSLRHKHGNWHVQLSHISESDAEQIGSRSDVAVISRHDVINDERQSDYFIGGRKAVLSGVDEAYIMEIRDCLEEGIYPRNDTEIILSPNAKTVLGVNTGDKVTVNTPAGNMDYTVSGFGEDDPSFNTLYGTVSAYMNEEAFDKICNLNGREPAPVYDVRFQKDTGTSGRIERIKEQYGLTDENIEVNKAILDITAIGRNSSAQTYYLAAVMLFMLVLLAGVLMIASSMNSNVAQRTQFFGMMRCLGMSKRQIRHFVRLEALNWCKTAIPAGLILGIVCTWGLCAAIR